MARIKEALSFSSVLTLFAFMTLGTLIHSPAPVKDRDALLKCLKLHPQRYCHITYNGLKP